MIKQTYSSDSCLTSVLRFYEFNPIWAYRLNPHFENMENNTA